VRALWEHIFGDQRGIVALFSGQRTEPRSKRLTNCQSAYFQYPEEIAHAERFCLRHSSEGCEVYFCAHLLNRGRRIKANAAPLFALYADGDGARVRDGMPEPTAVVESSPGREQFFWRMVSPMPAQEAELLNRRLAYAMGADESGWDLTQLMRVPGTRNHKYPETPIVKIVTVRDKRYDPQEFCALLPPLPEEKPKATYRSPTPHHIRHDADLSRLSPRMRDIILHGNRGEYPSRSNADFAACVAMFGAGYAEADVWAVMTNPANGISEKFFDKGRDGERYLALTIGKARVLAWAPQIRRRGSVRVGAPRVGAGIAGKVVVGLG
jgi:RepB DNA-primase from phage plasmid